MKKEQKLTGSYSSLVVSDALCHILGNGQQVVVVSYGETIDNAIANVSQAVGRGPV